MVTSIFPTFCFHIKQKYCIFFSPKALCGAQKVLIRRLRPRRRPEPDWGIPRHSRTTLVGLGGDTPPQIPLNTFGVSIFGALAASFQ